MTSSTIVFGGMVSEKELPAPNINLDYLARSSYLQKQVHPSVNPSLHYNTFIKRSVKQVCILAFLCMHFECQNNHFGIDF